MRKKPQIEPPGEAAAACRPDADTLAQMKQASQARDVWIDRLRASLSAMESTVLAEQMQLQRIEFAIEKAAREARYAFDGAASRASAANEPRARASGDEKAPPATPS